MKEKLFLDVQAIGSTDKIAELVARITVGVLVSYVALNELMQEVSESRRLKAHKQDGHQHGLG